MTVASLCNDILVLAVFLLVGFFVRELCKPLQKLFLPSSLIGGLILLLLGQQILGVVEVPESFGSIPSVMIDIVMAATVFGVTINRKKLGSYLDYSCMTMTSYGMQLGLGVLLGWLLQKIWPGLPDGWGVMGVFSFHGGHGTAAAAGAAFEKLGIEGNMAVGMVLSTLGLIVAMLVGMIMVNFGIRRGWGTYVKEPKKQPDYFYGGVLPEEKRVASGHTVTTGISINHLALQVAWLLTALFIGRKLFGFLGAYIPFFNELPSVLHGIFGGAILWQFLKATKLERYVDLKTIKLASGFCLEITVFTAMATLDMEFVSTYIVPVLIYTVILAVLTVPIIFYLAYRFCREEWFEKACMAFGAATGNTSTGLALVRAVDPDSLSSAGDTHGVYSAIMSWKDVFVGLTPIWLTSGIGLTCGVGFAMMFGFAAFGFIFFARKNNRTAA